MKKITTIMAATAGLALAASTSQAQLVVAGGSLTGLTQIKASTTQGNYSATVTTGTDSGQTLIGNLQSYVYSTGAGTLDFGYQLSETGNDAAGAQKFTIGGYGVPGVTVTAVFDINSAGDITTIGDGWSVTSGTLNIDMSTTGNYDKQGNTLDEILVVTSAIGSNLSSAAVIDDVSANAAAYSPAAVPEASTVMAGALMLLPLGIGAIRAIRKERTV